MPRPRKSLISLESTPYYHCVSRCVRRAFLCGKDPISSVSFEHRRQWIKDHLLELGELFAIDLCAYAVMHNHYHVVLHIDAPAAMKWDSLEVVTRWHRLFKGTALSQRFVSGNILSAAEQLVLDQWIHVRRLRLTDISWFMRILNEGIARKANKEDSCTGRFWEGRFKSQALLDEKALITCLAYVDLNPIRAGIAATPEQSEYTSIEQRIQSLVEKEPPEDTLIPFVGNPREDMPKGLPFLLQDYVELVDWTGRIIRDDKRGHINASTPPILERLDIDPKEWRWMTQHFESRFKSFVGSAFQVKKACNRIGQQWAHGIRNCEKAFPT